VTNPYHSFKTSSDVYYYGVNVDIKTVELYFKKEHDGIGLLDITRQVEHSIVDSKMNSGIATIHSENPNVCITTMEFEPGTIKDVTDAFERFAPSNGQKKGSRSNEIADVRPALVGPGITIPFRDNRIMIGKWQEIVMIDFDGTENKKKIVVQIIGE
jgi:secondary thiamine-phosphate synthase enzyme